MNFIEAYKFLSERTLNETAPAGALEIEELKREVERLKKELAAEKKKNKKLTKKARTINTYPHSNSDYSGYGSSSYSSGCGSSSSC